MSTSLAWSLPPKEIKWNYPDISKYDIGRYFDNDYNGDVLEVEVGSELIPFLKGYAAGSGQNNTVKDVAKMIEAIQKNGSIIISIH